MREVLCVRRGKTKNIDHVINFILYFNQKIFCHFEDEINKADVFYVLLDYIKIF